MASAIIDWSLFIQAITTQMMTAAVPANGFVVLGPGEPVPDQAAVAAGVKITARLLDITADRAGKRESSADSVRYRWEGTIAVEATDAQGINHAIAAASFASVIAASLEDWMFRDAASTHLGQIDSISPAFQFVGDNAPDAALKASIRIAGWVSRDTGTSLTDFHT